MIRPQHTRKSSPTFSVPAVLVTASDRRPSLSVYEQPVSSAGSAGQISPLSLPRPPRCLTPYPDTLNFSHSLEPSPLSSPAFSASSLPGDDDEDESEDDSEDGVEVAEPKTIMSPTSVSKATQHHARLLAPALQMSHLNSPTDIEFRELPLSPMRKVKSGSATSSSLASPVYTKFDGHLAAPTVGGPVDHDNDRGQFIRKPEPVRLNLRRVTTETSDDLITQRKAGFLPQEGRISVQFKVSSDSPKGGRVGSAGRTRPAAVSRASQQSARDGKVEMVHELQVHVETVQ